MNESGGDIFILNIGELATPLGARARSGGAMRDIKRIRDAAIVARSGVIEYAGSREDLPDELVEGLASMDAHGAAAVPGFVDSRAHLAFAGSSPEEFFARASGASRADARRSVGGSSAVVEATRAASLEELAAIGEKRAWEMLQQGVTTVEAKSGYGLDRETELKQLEASRLVAERAPIDVVPTYLGLGMVPPEFEGDARRYVDHAIAEILPAVAVQGIARFCEATCDADAFGVDDCRRFLSSAKALGLGLKLRAEATGRVGGSALAAELGAASADQLSKAEADDYRLLAAAGVIATCLPLSSFCMRERQADARAMIDSGLALALATDLNPDTAFSGSIPLMIAIAVLHMGLSIEEALTALTLNGAAALGLAGDRGSLEEGKVADFVLLGAPSIDYLPYRTGTNLVAATFKGGELAYRA
jgi:imidazolonepropionase